MDEIATDCYTSRPYRIPSKDASSQSCPGCALLIATSTNRSAKNFSLTTLRTAQGKLQLRGKLLDALKDEEAKLVRQAEQRQ